jgi:basic membrane protein A
MKKLLVVLLAMLLMAGCGSTTDEGEDPEEGKETIKVALLVGFLGDMSFNDSAARGVNQAAEEFDDVDVKIIEFGNTEDRFEPTLLDTADAGYDMIMVATTLQEYVEIHAKDFPDTAFVIFDTSVDYSKGGLDNVYSILYKANEASFLGGYIAAATSDTGVVGFLGGTDLPIISDFLVGYIQGAQEANPDIKVVSSYVGNWTDAAKGKDLSNTMFDQNASIVFGVAGGGGVGAMEAAVARDKLVLGVDSDQAMIFKDQGKEDFASVIVSSVLKNVDFSLYRAIDLYRQDKLPLGTTDTLGIEEGGVGLADNEYYQKLVSEEIRNKISELEEKVTDGDIVVDTAYGKTTDEINALKDSVKP